MASEKYKEIQALSLEELNSDLAETKSKYETMKFDHAVSGLENPLVIRDVRKDIARLKTELSQRKKSSK